MRQVYGGDLVPDQAVGRALLSALAARGLHKALLSGHSPFETPTFLYSGKLFIFERRVSGPEYGRRFSRFRVTGPRFRGLDRVGWMFTLAAADYNLVRMRNLSVQPA